MFVCSISDGGVEKDLALLVELLLEELGQLLLANQFHLAVD